VREKKSTTCKLFSRYNTDDRSDRHGTTSSSITANDRCTSGTATTELGWFKPNPSLLMVPRHRPLTNSHPGTTLILSHHPSRGCRSLWWACLSVCLHAYLKNHKSKLYQILCACCLWPWLGSALAVLQYSMYLRFPMFFYNGPYGSSIQLQQPHCNVVHTNTPAAWYWMRPALDDGELVPRQDEPTC